VIFKNFCPFPINSLYLSLGSENPSSLWLGTTWQKQEGRFLLGSSSTYGLGTTGGASTIKLTVANLPSHTHSATTAAHTHTQPAHKHQVGKGEGGYSGGAGYTIAQFNEVIQPLKYTESAGGDTTGSASPVTSIGSTGSGTAFSILPPYIAINIWKRLS
jgi:microcystin-dependent protein